MHTTGPIQGSGESRIRQRTVDTHRIDLSTNKFSEKYILHYRHGSQLVYAQPQAVSQVNPLQNTAILLNTVNTRQQERILDFISRPLLLFLLNIQAIWSKQGCIWFFQDHLDSFQDHCIFCINPTFWLLFSSKSKSNRSKHVQIQIFKFHCVYCAHCAPMQANLAEC